MYRLHPSDAVHRQSGPPAYLPVWGDARVAPSWCQVAQRALPLLRSTCCTLTVKPAGHRHARSLTHLTSHWVKYTTSHIRSKLCGFVAGCLDSSRWECLFLVAGWACRGRMDDSKLQTRYWRNPITFSPTVNTTLPVQPLTTRIRLRLWPRPRDGACIWCPHEGAV